MEDTITANFPTPVLTPIVGRPDYIQVNRIYEELCENATTVDSTLGGGNHGVLGLIVTPEIYATYSNTPFNMPARPPNVAAVIHLNAAEARQATI